MGADLEWGAGAWSRPRAGSGGIPRVGSWGHGADLGRGVGADLEWGAGGMGQT